MNRKKKLYVERTYHCRNTKNTRAMEKLTNDEVIPELVF